MQNSFISFLPQCLSATRAIFQVSLLSIFTEKFFCTVLFYCKFSYFCKYKDYSGLVLKSNLSDLILKKFITC